MSDSTLFAANGFRAWTSEEEARLVALWGTMPKSELAEILNRTPNAIQLRHQRLVPFDASAYVPAFGKSPGRRVYWTAERVEAGLRAFAGSHPGQLPNSVYVYSGLKKGHPEWPTAVSVLSLFGTMADAWAAIGEGRRRVTRQWVPWTQADDDYLLNHAGNATLKRIAKQLGRSWGACRRRLYDLGAGRARDVSGYLSAMQVAKLYDCPVTRVARLIASGVLPARKVSGGHYWRIDMEDCERVKAALSAPKRHSYQGSPSNHGDYEQRYGLKRVLRDGKVVRVARTDPDGFHVPVTTFRPYESRYAEVSRR